MKQVSGRLTLKMIRAAVKTTNAHPDYYGAAGLGLTGFVRTAIQNEIDRKAKGLA